MTENWPHPIVTDDSHARVRVGGWKRSLRALRRHLSNRRYARQAEALMRDMGAYTPGHRRRRP